jgi:hypothetical protein
MLWEYLRGLQINRRHVKQDNAIVYKAMYSCHLNVSYTITNDPKGLPYITGYNEIPIRKPFHTVATCNQPSSGVSAAIDLRRVFGSRLLASDEGEQAMVTRAHLDLPA